MASFSYQANPSRHPGVVLGLDAGDPPRAVLRARANALWAILGLVLLGFGTHLQLRGLRSDSPGAVLAATAIAWAGCAVVFLRRRVRLDRRLGRLEEMRGAFLPAVWRRLSISAFDRVSVTETARDASVGQATRYRVALDGPGRTYTLDMPGYWEAAVALGEDVARYLELPLEDKGRSGVRSPAELDDSIRVRKLRAEQGPESSPTGQWRTGRASCTVLADEPRRLRLRLERPAVALALLVNGLLAAFMAVPFAQSVWLPWSRGLPVEWKTVAFILFPVLLVGIESLRTVIPEGGELDVVPGRLRLLRNGWLGPRPVEIAAEEIEDLVLLSPEMGGPRTLLFWAGDGVLVARSDAAAVRFGYGLAAGELRWVRRRMLEVLRAGGPGATPYPGGGARPVALRRSTSLRLPLAGLVTGAVIAAAWRTPPLSRCLALPFLEHMANTGAAIGWLGGLVADARRHTPATLLWTAVPAVALLAILWTSPPGLVRARPTYDERRGFESTFTAERTRDPRADRGRRDRRDFLVGWLLTAGLANALAVELALAGWSRRRLGRNEDEAV